MLHKLCADDWSTSARFGFYLHVNVRVSINNNNNESFAKANTQSHSPMKTQLNFTRGPGRKFCAREFAHFYLCGNDSVVLYKHI